MKLLLLFVALVLAAVSCEQAKTIDSLKETMASMMRNPACMTAMPNAKAIPHTRAPRPEPMPQPEAEPVGGGPRSIILI